MAGDPNAQERVRLSVHRQVGGDVQGHEHLGPPQCAYIHREREGDRDRGVCVCVCVCVCMYTHT